MRIYEGDNYIELPKPAAEIWESLNARRTIKNLK
jgi:hypothetical protein